MSVISFILKQFNQIEYFLFVNSILEQATAFEEYRKFKEFFFSFFSVHSRTFVFFASILCSFAVKCFCFENQNVSNYSVHLDRPDSSWRRCTYIVWMKMQKLYPAVITFNACFWFFSNYFWQKKLTSFSMFTLSFLIFPKLIYSFRTWSFRTSCWLLVQICKCVYVWLCVFSDFVIRMEFSTYPVDF